MQKPDFNTIRFFYFIKFEEIVFFFLSSNKKLIPQNNSLIINFK